MLNAVKNDSLALKSAVLFDMYSQQFTYVIAWSKASFFVFAFEICLRHQSVTPFLKWRTFA